MAGDDSTGSPPDGRMKTLMGLLLVALLLVAIGALLWFLPFGSAVVADAHKRNQLNLAIAAHGLEAWSGAIDGVAYSHFARSRIQPLPAASRDNQDGWTHSATMNHPVIGSYRILYAVGPDTRCGEIRKLIETREGKLPFVRSYQPGGGTMLKMVGSFPVDRAFADDVRSGATALAEPQWRADIVGETGAGDTVCYGAVIPIDRLIGAGGSPEAFSTLMVVDARQQIVAQVGPDPLPLRTLDGLVPASSVLMQKLAASISEQAGSNEDAGTGAVVKTLADAFAAQAEKADAAGKVGLADALKPIEMDLGGRTMVAYVRPFFPPAEAFPACAAGTEGEASGPSLGQCFVVGLVPKSGVVRQAVNPPLTMLVWLGLGVGLILTLLPAVRLLLLGPAEAMPRAEAAAHVLGIPAAASLATLLLLFAADLAAHRAEAATQAQQIATDAAAELGRHIDATIRLGAANPGTGDPGTGPDRATLCNGDGNSAIDAVWLFDSAGNATRVAQRVQCADNAGQRAAIGGRDYFARLKKRHASLADGFMGEKGAQSGACPGCTPYVVAQVMTIPDGLSKTVVAWNVDAPGTGTDEKQVRLVSSVDTRLMNPVLPPPYSLMVVDTRDPSLPIVMHADPARAGAEKLATMLRDPGTARELLRQAANSADSDAGPVRFGGIYEGTQRQFAAAGAPGTRWAVIVHYAEDDVALGPARTVAGALLGWAAMSILFGGAWLLWLAHVGQRGIDPAPAGAGLGERLSAAVALGKGGWPRLWPQEERSGVYARLAPQFVAMAAAALLVVLLAAATPLPAVFALLAGLAARAGAGLLLHWRLQNPPPAADALTPQTQARYKRLALALLLCLSVVPMLGFWMDARAFDREAERAEMFAAVAGPEGRTAASGSALMSLADAQGRSAWARLPAPFGVEATAAQTAPAATQGWVSEELWEVRTGNSQPRVPGCGKPERPAQPTPATRVPAALQVCPSIEAAQGIEVRQAGLLRTPPGPLAWLLLTVLAVLLTAGLLQLVDRVLRAMCGFGVALEAVVHPMLWVGDLFGKPQPSHPLATLNRKSMLVNAPYSLLTILGRLNRANSKPRQIHRIDVADATTMVPDLERGDIILVGGLDMVLADRDRRLDALALLEQLVNRLDDMGEDSGARLLFFSQAAPMDRILDAHERNTSGEGGAEALDTKRENLRWARLFEDFATFHFRPIQVTRGQVDAEMARASKLHADRLRALACVVREMRWMPPRVVNGALAREPSLTPTLVDAAQVPIDPGFYLETYRMPILEWTLARGFVGRKAALDYMRAQFIEYYQRLWSASTRAERLVLHHLAHGRFVHINQSLSFAALVRRGLVVLDPEPRLMNDSFAMFVLQVEKPDAIREWRDAQAPSAWMKTRLPILLGTGLLVAAMLALAVLAGQQVTSLLPVLAAGAPALLAALNRVLRPA